MTTAIEQTLETYGIENWGAGYFGVNRKGNLIVHPSESDTNASADLKEIIDDLSRRGIQTPVLLRFPQLVTAQVRKLQRAFRNSIREFEYQGSHMCVYPMKVNQQRAVVEEYLREGSRYDFGLEAGSKAELYAALALEQSEESLLVLNGFKDEEFIELAFVGARAGKRVIIVIEKMSELGHVLRLAEKYEEDHDGDLPMVGIRVKLYSKGSGRWEKSGGEAAKFGLTTTEILEVIRRLQEEGRIEMLKLLHFHIGSQLTDIKRIKNAMKEAARVYAKIYQMKIPIELLDVGGGMAVDYDGSKTAFDSSANYNAQEFANDVIYTIKQVCDDENVPHPTVIQESGRYLSAYHAILVTNIQDEIETVVEDITPIELDDDDPQVVIELGELREAIGPKNYREYYHDALEHREELFTLFNLGLISLEDRAKGEVLFWDVCERADKFAQVAEYVSEEFDDLRRLSRAKYLANFSVFRSVPDHWALDQLFPIVPIHKLNKPPTAYATLCDITCDSDGVVDKFVDLHDVKNVLELHPLVEGEPYYIAFMLVGAYQEVMGNNHNLFGTPHEAQIYIDEDGYLIKKVIRGMTVGEAAQTARYDRGMLHEGFRRQVAQRVKHNELTQAEAAQLVDFYESRLGAYTYLSVNGKKRP
ncbi:MAG: arginine decarboxylase [Acidobacteriota bacterium]|nr:arginine decarboxylase [Acidobacteriota bacterium]